MGRDPVCRDAGTGDDRHGLERLPVGRWGGERTQRAAEAQAAIVRTGKFANLAEQKLGIHSNLFGQWATAFGTGNTELSDFLFNRFPEPLKTAAVAWRAMGR